MSIAIRDRRDPVAEQLPLPGLIVKREEDVALMSALQARARDEIERRFAGGHRAYVARIIDEPAAFGWVATQSAKPGTASATTNARTAGARRERRRCLTRRCAAIVHCRRGLLSGRPAGLADQLNGLPWFLTRGVPAARSFMLALAPAPNDLRWQAAHWK